MSKKAKKKVKTVSLPPLSEGYGYVTPERIKQSGTFVAPKNLSSPGYMQGAVNSEYAPNYAEKSELEKALKPHEMNMLNRFVIASDIANTRARGATYEGGSLPKGKRGAAGLPYKYDEDHIFKWYQRIMGAGEERFKKLAVPDFVKCGMEFYYRLETGNEHGYSLSDVGKVMVRAGQQYNQERVIGGYIAFYLDCVHNLEHSERLISREINMDKVVNKRKIHFAIDKSF